MRFLYRLIRRLIFWVFVLMIIWLIFFRDKDKAPIQPSETPAEQSTKFIPPIPPTRDPITPDAPIEHVVVDKSERKLYLQSRGMSLREFSIALGSAPEGHKTRQGDGKTPIGEYTLDWRNPQSSFYRSLHVSYPTPAQTAEAQAAGRDPGGMIMIHGQPNGSHYKGNNKITSDWTDGCIAVSNAEMDEIWARVADGTKITIIE